MSWRFLRPLRDRFSKSTSLNTIRSLLWLEYTKLAQRKREKSKMYLVRRTIHWLMSKWKLASQKTKMQTSTLNVIKKHYSIRILKLFHQRSLYVFVSLVFILQNLLPCADHRHLLIVIRDFHQLPLFLQMWIKNCTLFEESFEVAFYHHFD